MSDRCVQDDCLDKEEAVRRLVKAARDALPAVHPVHVRGLQAAIDFARPYESRDRMGENSAEIGGAA